MTLVLGGTLMSAEPPQHRVATSEEPAAIVNGDAITTDEIREALQRCRTADVAIALEDCLRTRIVLQLARRRGLVLFTGELEMHIAHREENLRRREAQERGEPVFGPSQLTWPAFRLWWLNSVERELQRKIVESTPAPGVRQLETFYAAHRERFTPEGATAPLAFASIADQVRRAWEESRYHEAVAAARKMARIEVNGIVLARVR